MTEDSQRPGWSCHHQLPPRHDPHRSICRARAHGGRTLGLHLGCIQDVLFRHPQSDRGDSLPEVEEVAAQPDLQTAFRPDLMPSFMPGDE